MDHSFDIPCEARLSNSIFKNRLKLNQNKTPKSKQEKLITADLNNAELTPGDPDPVEKSEMTSENNDNRVVYRTPSVDSANRVKNLTKADAFHRSISFNPSNTTLFYITSSTPDDNSMTYSNSSVTSDQPSLSVPKQEVSVTSKEDSLVSHDQADQRLPAELMSKQPSPVSILIDDFANSSISINSGPPVSRRTTIYLEKAQENPSNCQCADCNSENPTVAIMSWLLVICKKCAAIHRLITSDFLRLQSLLTIACDPHLIELLVEFGNQFSNNLLENDSSLLVKPTEQSNDLERQQYIRKKYIEKIYLQSYYRHRTLSQDELNRMLYENVETTDYGKTIHLFMLGANANYSDKMFSVADHAKRHQQTKQMKIILANGGFSDFDFMKSNLEDVNESIVYLSTKYGVLKEFLTRYENNHLKIFPVTSDKSQRCLFEIDLNNILAIHNQSIHGISLKCRLSNAPPANVNCQCSLIVDDRISTNEYECVFASEIERSVWIREIIKREYSYHQLIYPNFILLMKLNVQEGINAEKQQVIAIVYAGRFVLCSDTIFDEVDLRKYSSLTYQKTREFTGVILCLVSNRFLYLSSPISKLTNMLYSCLREAVQVRTLTDINQQILTSQNIPVIVERFVNFIFERGLQTKGIYRQAGQESKVRQLLNECLADPFTHLLSHENYSEHDVANALKRFLRHLDVPLLGTRQSYHAWLRSTVDDTMTEDQLIQYYRVLIKDLKQHLPINYATLRLMLIHMHAVAALSSRNGMTLSNLISTFAPCLISQDISVPLDYKDNRFEYRNRSLDDLDKRDSEDDEESYLNQNNRRTSANLKRNQSLHSKASRRLSIASASPSQFPVSSAYVHVTPSIQANLIILTNLCKYYCELFDITYDELEHEKNCIETLISFRENQLNPRLLDGAMISVYFESRSDELNGYAMNIFEEETTADMVVDKLLKQVNQNDCFFWCLFEVIIDQTLERPMYSCENISEVLYRYRTYLSHELNRQATFVVKLNYIQFEKERLAQRQSIVNNHSTQCEYFDITNQRWMPCLWIFEKATLEVHRVVTSANEKSVKWKGNVNSQDLTASVSFDQQTLIKSWSIEEIYLYIGADCRFVTPFDMNEYRIMTVLPPEIPDGNSSQLPFGFSFRFADRNQMFSWYLEIVRNNGHDKWSRRASRTLPNGISYLPLQNYHASSSVLSKKRSIPMKSKIISKTSHVASNFCKQLRK
ncbi:unnamed protein product [Adineta ricciae]|uniref:Uncharacterized protein n=2 Tax=Adineta ricciae TaxID=249248 RepID=A0A814QRZ6_ADIRI|nr:unnamed protein product [Adineta ricciae]